MKKLFTLLACSAFISIQAQTIPTISISVSPAGPICAGTNVTFTASITNGGASPTYQWQINGGNVGPNSSTYSSTTFANSDVVTCIFTSSDPLASPTTVTSNSIVMVVGCAGIEDEEILQVNVYPNPTSDLFTVSLSENIIGGAKITLLNLVGQTVYAVITYQAKTIVSAESLGLKAGIYLVQIKYKSQNKVVRVIIR